MGKWSNLGDGSAVNYVKLNQTLETKNGSTHDLDYIVEESGLGGCKIRLRSLFDEVLRAFLSERSENKCFRPVPALLGDGRPVDLFRLFWVVRRIGGYDLVCRENLWGFVVGQCGLGFGAIALVKLVYVKYLNEFDQWLWCLYWESSLENGESGIGRKLDLFSREMEAKCRGSFFSGGEENKIETEFVELEYDRCRKFIELDNGENDVHLSVVGNVDELHEDAEYSTNDDVEKLFVENDNDLVFSAKRVVEKVINEAHDDTKQQINDNNGNCCAQEDDDVVESVKKVLENIVSKVHEYSENYIDDFEDGMCADNDDSISVPVTNVVEKVLDFRKRKRESSSLSGMLSWIKHVAKHSDDLAIGQLPKCSECKTHGTDKPWIQVLLAREARSIGRHTSLNAEESPLQQKRLRMQPSRYGDDELNKKLRGSERHSSQTKFHLYTCSNSCTATQTKVVSSQKTELGNDQNEPVLQSIEVLETDTKNDIFTDESPRVQVAVGPLFQADVPDWTDMIPEIDCKWLGTRMWPPEDGQNKFMMELLPIGKGRENSCDCPFPDSVECIRFHIAEKRLNLKLELGSLFYRWRFDRMGEEVSLSWRVEEENRFKDMVRLNAATGNKSWNNASKMFHFKTRENLVSYYFNVFLVQRRSYQNRVTPKDIDSDDDEKQFGSVGEHFGYRALQVPGFRLLTCTQNKACIDLE